MAKMTEKQQRYVEARASGSKKIDAARYAGYAGRDSVLSVAASKLEAQPAIRNAIARAKKGAAKAEVAQESDDKFAVMKPSYQSSLSLMQDCYNNPKLPPSLRFEAAKQALPYEHAKIGEKGKKEDRKDRANEVAQGRFATKQPPKLRAVN